MDLEAFVTPSVFILRHPLKNLNGVSGSPNQDSAARRVCCYWSALKQSLRNASVASQAIRVASG